MSMPTAAKQKDLETWAEVRAHDRVVRYRRSGAVGPVVLLLQPPSPSPSAPLWPELLRMIREGSRLIVPDPPTDEVEGDAWLSALLEGLGMRNVTVVATHGFCIAALERALLSPEQIARVIMVCSGRGSESGVDGKLATQDCCRPVPILMLRRDRPASEILPLVESFLSG